MAGTGGPCRPGQRRAAPRRHLEEREGNAARTGGRSTTVETVLAAGRAELLDITAAAEDWLEVAQPGGGLPEPTP